jgi:hypothetical protein
MSYINWQQLTPALQQLADDYVEYAIAKLRSNGSYNTGKLARSLKLVTPTEQQNKITVSVEMLQYGFWVDNGAKRGPGRRPPVSSILEWIKEKRISVPQGMKDTQFAWLIARSIGAKGQRFKKAKPFIQSSLRNALDNNMQNIANKGAIDIMKRIKQDIEGTALKTGK